MTADVVAEQQLIADTFHDLKLIPLAVAIHDALWSPPREREPPMSMSLSAPPSRCARPG